MQQKECSCANFLFSTAEPWRLVSPEGKTRGWTIFYLVWRWVWALFFLTFIILTGVLPQTWYKDENQRVKWFIYLTNWGFFVFTFAQLFNAISVTIAFATGAGDAGELKFYMKFNWLLYELSSTPAILITLMFWAVIYSDEYPSEPDTFVTHGVNGAFVLIDMWVTAMPIRALHLYIPTLFGLIYVLFSLVYDLSGGSNALLSPYIYRSLDWNGGTIYPPIYSVGAIVGLVILFFILFGLHKLRVFLYGKCYPHATHPISTESKARYDSVAMRDY